MDFIISYCESPLRISAAVCRTFLSSAPAVSCSSPPRHPVPRFACFLLILTALSYSIPGVTGLHNSTTTTRLTTPRPMPITTAVVFPASSPSASPSRNLTGWLDGNGTNRESREIQCLPLRHTFGTAKMSLDAGQVPRRAINGKSKRKKRTARMGGAAFQVEIMGTLCNILRASFAPNDQ